MKFVFGVILFTSAVFFNSIELSSSSEPPRGPGPFRPDNPPPPFGPNNPPPPFGPNNPRPQPFGPREPVPLPFGPRGPGPHPFGPGGPPPTGSGPHPPGPNNQAEVEAAVLRRQSAQDRYINSLLKNVQEHRPSRDFRPPGPL